MRQWVVFENPGVAELAALTTFGVNVKTSESAIGHFGTGFKYAVAVILRGGGKVVLLPGDGTRWEFVLRGEHVRGKLFDMVYLESTRPRRPLGFTSELGKEWVPWMAYRELVCNAWDEGGDARQWSPHSRWATEGAEVGRPDEPWGKTGHTRLCVCWDDMLSVHAQRGRWFLRDRPMAGTWAGVEVYHGMAENVFYRGVAAAQLLEGGRSLHTYNIAIRQVLTEDRSLKHPQHVPELVAHCLIKCTEPELIEPALVAPEGTLEHGLKFAAHHGRPSEEFLAVARRLRDDPSNLQRLNPSVHGIFERMGVKEMRRAPRAQLSAKNHEMLLRCKAALWSVLGVDVDRFEVIVVDSLGTDVLGRAYDECIFVSLRAFDMGERMLMGTLYEEWMHLAHKYEDETRSTQNFLLDMLMRQVEYRASLRPLRIPHPDGEEGEVDVPEFLCEALSLRNEMEYGWRPGERGAVAGALVDATRERDRLRVKAGQVKDSIILVKKLTGAVREDDDGLPF